MRFANDWDKFARAIIKVGDDHMDQEIEKFEQEKHKHEKNTLGDKDAFDETKMQEFLQSSSIQQLVLNEFNMLLGVCLKQNQRLLMGDDEDIIDVVLSQKVSLELICKLRIRYEEFQSKELLVLMNTTQLALKDKREDWATCLTIKYGLEADTNLCEPIFSNVDANKH